MAAPRAIAPPLSLIFFLSGAAALLFETLWFRLAGLTFGNTAWASAIVLGSFMTGLALGNAMASRIAPGRNAFRLYALLEAGIAITGLTLVLILPATQDWFAPLFRRFLTSEIALNSSRLVLAFALLCVPTTLMGATLPTVVGAFSRSEGNFGRALGLLYGWNTMGAVAGALAGEIMLIRALGVRGTGFVAALTSAAACALAWIWLPPWVATKPQSRRWSPRALPILIAAAASGFALLALEVIWFRFVVLFIFATSLAFAVMLAVVLLGIAAGALAASVLLRKDRDADRWTTVVASASGLALIVCYWGFRPVPLRPGGEELTILVDSVRLMLPVSILSGVLFTFIGRSVERELQDETWAAAAVTVFNTVGAAIGSAVACFVLIPKIGIERSFVAIGAIYAAVAILTLRARLTSFVAATALIVVLLLFPGGVFTSTFIPLAVADYLPNSRIVAVREGPIETAIYLRTDMAGKPYTYRLFTNGYSMSSTAFASKRYMSLFAYLPLSLRPSAKKALLISYGVGITAHSLVSVPQLESIDVVDISRDILEMSEIVWPGASNPLRDPRVRVHVEDGRFFLRTSNRRFDLITAEPPPPKTAGVVSLYTEEYFRLLRDRLTEDGIASYWLPVYQLEADETRAIIAAFCNAFDDCSLWSGAGLEWILVGSRDGIRAATLTAPSSRWLEWIGVEKPEQIAATFLADASDLRRFVAGAAPLTDDHPLRLAPHLGGGPLPEYAAILANARSAFLRSELIGHDERQRAVGYLGAQRLIDERFTTRGAPADPRVLHAILTGTDLRILPRILMRTDMWVEQIAREAGAAGRTDPEILYILAVGAMADRDYATAARLFRECNVPAYEKLAATLAGAQKRDN